LKHGFLLTWSVVREEVVAVQVPEAMVEELVKGKG
jgi:hypothetical protein